MFLLKLFNKTFLKNLFKDRVKTAFRNFDFQTFILIVMLGNIYLLMNIIFNFFKILFCLKSDKINKAGAEFK